MIFQVCRVVLNRRELKNLRLVWSVSSARGVALHQPPEWILIEFSHYLQRRRLCFPSRGEVAAERRLHPRGGRPHRYMCSSVIRTRSGPQQGGQISEEHSRAETRRSQELIARVYELQASQQERPSLNAAPAV